MYQYVVPFYFSVNTSSNLVFRKDYFDLKMDGKLEESQGAKVPKAIVIRWGGQNYDNGRSGLERYL
jgi:hypothetical protein